MSRRIQRLTTRVQQLARGDQNLPLSVPGQDPVGLLAQAIDELATELHSQIQLAEAERERLATVLSHMADGVIITGRDGSIQLANLAAAQLLRLPSVPKGRSL